MKLVAVISVPLLRVTLSPNTRLDLAFVKSFSFNLLSDFPYPTENPPLPILPLNPFLDSLYEYVLLSSLEYVLTFPPIKLLSPSTKLLSILYLSLYLSFLYSFYTKIYPLSSLSFNSSGSG